MDVFADVLRSASVSGVVTLQVTERYLLSSKTRREKKKVEEEEGR